MRRLATLLVLATAFSFQGAAAATLREQLALAEKAEDTHSRIELLRRILEKEPADDGLREQLVRLWLQIEDYDMAEVSLKEWKIAPASLQAEVGAEILFRRDDKAPEAIALLEAYRTTQPADMAIIRQLARYYGSSAENQKLADLLDTAPGVGAEPDLLLTRAGSKRALGNFEAALADFALVEQASEETAKDARPAYDRLKAALPAIQAANARVAQNPDDFAALVARAQLLAYIGSQNALIRADAERAWKAAPQSVAARLLYARVALSNLKARQELSVDLSAAEPPPANVERLLKLDEALTKNPNAAAALARRSFELNDAPAQYALALLDADAALAIDPANAPALVEKIFALVKLGKVPDAAATLLVLEKSTPPADRLGRACQYLAEGEMTAFRFQSALDYANRGLKAKPTVSLYQTRATILNRLGRMAESQADLASAKKLEKK